MRQLLALLILLGSSVPVSAEEISRNSAEGLCQSLAYELFPEFKAWFDTHSELRPLDAMAYLDDNDSQKQITTIPMNYDFPNGTKELRFVATLPQEVRKQHPSIDLSCEGVMTASSGNRIDKLTFNGQVRQPGPNDDWTF